MPKRYSKESRQYTPDQLQEAVLAVKGSILTVSAAAREFSIPRKTLDDHVKKEVSSKPGPAQELTNEEESAIVEYAKYLANRGFPMTRSIVRQFVISVVKKSGRTSRFNLEKGPSDKWFRTFFAKHPELTEREPEAQDRSRNRMSNPVVMKQYFDLLKETVDRLQVKPQHIFNCDETGWSGKEKSKQKVIAVKGHHSYQQSVISTGHVTAHLCICADGRILPTFVIFEKSLPHMAHKEGVPGDWLFGYSESGYMDSTLFLQWFKRVFIPNCGPARPVLLIMDNHDSHTTLDVIECAIENKIELLGLPPHTTHILQPLDVSVNGPLKSKFSSTAVTLGHLNKQQTVTKAKFPAVLYHAIDELCSPARIKDAFKKTGISPLNPDAIDKSQLTKSHFETINSSDGKEKNRSTSEPSTSGTSTEDKSETSICTSCGTFLGTNPLVTEGLIPEHLSSIFTPVPCGERGKKENKGSRESAETEREREEKGRKRQRKSSTRDGPQETSSRPVDEALYICKICDTSDGGHDEDTLWIACDNCEDWVHPQCAGLQEEEDLESLAFMCPQCLEE
ncbi:hypothetical protein FSP39_007466 [Pinctada imbricata]|uniref:PHD-type domain-containing protein n=1 Tax=Pinctada imbricata TaxID=66713 RepID=A0AA88YUK1_PINIB|nr:hypothetical protein FSP39_007466 [Pinctada imbricata]